MRASAHSSAGPVPRQSPITFLLFTQMAAELSLRCAAPCAITELLSITDERRTVTNHHQRRRYSMLKVGSAPSPRPAPSGVPPRWSTVCRTERVIFEPPEHHQAAVCLHPPHRQLASDHDSAPFKLHDLCAGSTVLFDSTVGHIDHSFKTSPLVPHQPDNSTVEEIPR
jgi:hypothetical protein